MLRAIVSIFVATAFVAVFVRSAAAEELRCEGTIVKVEGENVTVKEGTNDRMMKVEPGTKITSGGKPVSAMDLKVGQRVTCICDRRDGKIICTTMELMRDTP